MRAVALVAVAGSACFSAWDAGGLWACSPDGGCADGLTCDDGVCCSDSASPACPTRPRADGGCDGAAPVVVYRDDDGDGAGAQQTSRTVCRAPARGRWVPSGTDCDDALATIGPLAPERCNGRDDDCDGEVDEGLGRQTWYRDGDGDGFGATCAGCTVEACGPPPGFAARGGDCDDDAPGRNPAAVERCDGVDDNCNGVVDDAPFVDAESPGSPTRADCVAPGQLGACAAGGRQCLAGVSTCVPRVGPTFERCGDGLDNDCDGTTDGQPGCRGPASLVAIPGGRYRALRLDGGVATPTGLPPRCVGNEPGSRAMAWLNPAWIGNGASPHVLVFAPPPGQRWDLSGGFTLVLDVETSLIFAGSGSGWVSPSPVVTLCGARPDAYLRLYPAAGTFTGSFTVTLTGASGWTKEVGATPLDLGAVESLEIAVTPAPSTTGLPTFTMEWKPGAGFR